MDPNENATVDPEQAAWDEEARMREAGDDSLPSADRPADSTETPTDPDSAATSPESEAQTPEPPEQSQAADPYEGLPPTVAERLRAVDRQNAELQQANQALLHRISSAEGRVATMQREFQQARQAAASVPAHDAPTKTEMAAAAQSPEKWEALKKDFPDWAEAVEEYVAAQTGAVQSAPGIDPRVVARFMHDQISQVKTTFGRELEYARIEGKYPDWKEQVNSPEFSDWALAQPPEVIELAHSTRAADAIRMLDLYHDAKQKSASHIKQGRVDRLQSAAMARPGQTPPPRSVDEMSEEELWNYEARRREKERQQQGL